jgi:hypothetical protein
MSRRMRWAASLSPSAIVRYGAHVSATCWVVKPVTSLITPRVSRSTIARGTCTNGSTDVTGMYAAAIASDSVSPTEAIAGLVKVTLGMSLSSNRRPLW